MDRFEGDSVMARLGDVCTIVSGTTPKSNCPEYWDGEINWVTPAELNDDSDVICESQRKITEQAVQDSNLKPFPAGTVLLSSRAPIGKVAIAGVEMYCNQGFKNLICSNRIYNRYLYYFLKNSTEYLNSLGRGATFKEISKSIVENIEIPLPSLDEQRRIAAVLDKVSGLIAKRREQLDKLDELLKARFVEMFGDPVSNPKGWNIIRLSELGDCKNGMNFHTDDSGVEIHCLGVGDFKNLSSISDTAKLPIITLNEMPTNDYLLKNGDIVFVRSNGNKALVGRSVIVYPDDTPTTFSGFCIRFRIQNPIILPQYLLSVLKTASMRKQMTGRGANIQNLNQKILSELKIPVSPLPYQEEYIDFTIKIDKSKLTIQQSLDKLEVLKKALMQQYFG